MESYKRKCDHCGKDYEGTGRKYCSSHCGARARRPRKPKKTSKRTEYTCLQCNKTFVAYEVDGRKYCSRQCSKLGAMSPPTPKVCPQCGKTFYKPDHPRQRNCSLACSNDARKKAREPSAGTEAPAQDILAILQKGPQSVGQLSRDVDRSKETIIKVLDDLREKGYEVNLDTERGQAVLEREGATTLEPLEIEPFYRHKMRIGVVSDTQLGSKYQQLTLLQTAYKEFEQEKVEIVLHGGDLFDGIKMYRGHEAELFLHEADQQLDYATEHYPTYTTPTNSQGKTLVVGGNHDDSFRKIAGYNILRQLCIQREDIEWRGTPEALFDVRELRVGMLHPTGGTGFARSYQAQRKFEGLVSDILATARVLEEHPKQLIPRLFFIGHYHVGVYLAAYMGSDVWVLPCLQSRTPYLQAKGLAPVIGYMIFEIHWDKDKNITRIVPDMRIRNAYVRKKDY